MSSHVHVLDFSTLKGDRGTADFELCSKLVHALKKTGFVKIVNLPGLDEETRTKLFQTAKEYFKLSHSQKMSGPHPASPSPHRGYSYVGQEAIAGISGFEKGKKTSQAVKDIKETFDMGPSDDKKFPNVWPSTEHMPHFRLVMEATFDILHESLLQILHCVETGLGLPIDRLSEMHRAREHEFRLLHYPAVPASRLEEGSGSVRIAEHSDFGSLTFLLQDAVGGLMVEDQEIEGLFHPLESGPGEIVLNVGDCLQRWTGALLRSANHKVVMPQTKQGDRRDSGAGEGGDREAIVPERFSIAFFGKPDRHAVVHCLPELRSSSSVVYESLTAGDYNMQKLIRTY